MGAFDDGTIVRSGCFIGAFVIWLLGALLSLGILGVVIWGIIKFVNYFTV